MREVRQGGTSVVPARAGSRVHIVNATTERKRTMSKSLSTVASAAALAASRAPRTVVTIDAGDDTLAVTSTDHAIATLAVETLAATLASATLAGSNVIVTAYGADVKLSVVKLALAAAREVTGVKSRGQQRVNVLAVLAALGDVPPTDRAVVAASQSALDARNAANAARTARKSELAKVTRDSKATAAARMGALEVLTGMDEQDALAKRHAAGARLSAAIDAYRLAGGTQDSALAMLADAFSDAATE